MPETPPALEVGAEYDLEFPARPDLGTVRVIVRGTDEATPGTPCGAKTVMIEIVSGKIPRSNPHRIAGPGDIFPMAIFVARWKRAPKHVESAWTGEDGA